MIRCRQLIARAAQSIPVLVGLCVCAVAYGQAVAPQTPPEVHVNERCQQRPPFTVQFAAKADEMFCRLESIKRTQHSEWDEVNGKRKQVLVTVAEQQYVLHNLKAERVVFVVEHRVPSGWHVDCEPRPEAMSGNTAIFRASAEPGQTVRLHVGIRTTKLPSLGPEEPIIPGAPDIRPPWEEIRY